MPLGIWLEGESLFNDAVCIVVFTTLLTVINGQGISAVDIVENFVYEIVVAILIGIVFGNGVLRLLNGKHEMESLILSTALLASGSYLVAFLLMLRDQLPVWLAA